MIFNYIVWAMLSALQRFPVAKIVKPSSRSVTIQLLKTPEIDRWVRSWGSEDIPLYPRKQQKVPDETEL